MLQRYDLLLSSGFLCFSSHVGFLTALEDSGAPRPEAYVGTSSGSLAAAFAAAGMSAAEVGAELSAQRPISLVRPAVPFRRGGGVASSRALLRRLREVLPPSFDELPSPLAVGVYTVPQRQPVLITSGDLPAAVAASCAVPGIFRPVRVAALDGTLCADGGAVDRTGYDGWRTWRPDSTAALVHLVSDLPDGEHGPRDGVDAGSPRVASIVRTPRAKASFVSLRDFDAQVRVAADQASASLASVF